MIILAQESSDLELRLKGYEGLKFEGLNLNIGKILGVYMEI
jgi:hypothetical protein